MITTQSVHFEVSGKHAHSLLEYCKKNDTEPQLVLEWLVESLDEPKKGERTPNLLRTLVEQRKPREPGLLAHLNIEVDDGIWFEPMSEAELAWWNGNNTDKYGISL